MRRKFAKFSVCSLLFLASSFSAAAYEPPFSRTESVAIESPNALFLRWEKTDGDADSHREPRLTGKQQRDGATVFRFRFRQPGRYRLFFQIQNHDTAETTSVERELSVGVPFAEDLSASENPSDEVSDGVQNEALP